VLTNVKAAPWLFEGLGLRNGSHFGHAGIEIDHTAATSPPTTRVLAQIPNVLGPGRTAQMTYYETNRGAKVFAAGAFTLAGYAKTPLGEQLLENLWVHCAEP
jgi:hypothetical protein